MKQFKFSLHPILALSAFSILLFGGFPEAALAHHHDVLDSGDTSWMLMATALVLFMTLPGLSLFYAGSPAPSMSCPS